MIGPDAVIRPTIVRDTWLSSAAERIERLARGRAVLLGAEIEAEVPVEARCRLCEVRPLEPGESEEDYTAYLKTEGAAIGPVTLGNAQRWLTLHLRAKHGKDGIAGSYEVVSGSERWVT